MVVPTRAAAAQLTRSIEARLLPQRGAVLLPDIATPRELTLRLGERLGGERRMLTGHEREVLLGVACRAARDGGFDPPFRLRPALIAEILAFYDELRRRQNSIDEFERRALSQLEPGAAEDRGAERLVRQTRFLAEAFREFERRSAEHGGDEHQVRARIIATPADRPYRHIVLAVTDAAFDAHGLFSAEWDLLARVPGLDRLDVVVTDTMIAGALHERVHQVLPGIEEVRLEIDAPTSRPVLMVPGGTEVRLKADTTYEEVRLKAAPTYEMVHRARDREEEVAAFARRLKAAVRSSAITSLDRVALVVKQPLPYVYLARDVLRSAAIPCQMFDALPLAAEPYAAALDLVFSCVSANGARLPAIALLRSPHFQFAADDERYASDVMALDRALAEAGYLGEVEPLERLVGEWESGTEGRLKAAPTYAKAAPTYARAGRTLSDVLRHLLPLASPVPVASHLTVLIEFLHRYDRSIDVTDPLAARQLRARGAIHATLRALHDAYARFDSVPVDADMVAALVRRWIDSQTFAPRTGESGVHVLDASSAALGHFELVQLAGVMDGEWPERPRRNIFYSAGVLRELGWPAESDRLDGERAAFADLLRLATSRVAVSVFTLEADALVSPSSFIDEVAHAALETVRDTSSLHHIFDHEVLVSDSMAHPAIAAGAREWAMRRRPRTSEMSPRFRGQTDAFEPPALSLTALERYQECPFKFFAADVLRLEEAPEDESMLSPRARGRFIHEVFERFFAAWHAKGHGAITYARLSDARALMREVADTQLARLPDADAALERTRLFGSAISRGMADVVLEHEVEHPAPVVKRLLEHRFEGEFALGSADGRRARLRGVADRIDLLDGRRLRVFDYKSGSAPNPRRALQVPIYALSAQEELAASDGNAWSIDEAAYLVFTGKKSYVPIVSPGGSARDNPLEAARERLFAITDGVAAGAFPPRPHEPIICTWCPYPSVCRKDDIDAD